MALKRARPPSIESVLASVRPAVEEAIEADALLAATRDVVDEERTRLAADGKPRSSAVLADEVLARLGDLAGARGAGLVEVINASGVIVHTNLGRTAWPRAAIEAASRAAAGTVLLELDRASGRRGRRYPAAEEHLVALTGAEDALVTNNNAAALALVVGLASRRGVVVSRGELVEIGGGVRIPEIIRRAGARLVEVGTTNRTRAVDYEEPLVAGKAALILRVHHSNFRQEGFVESPDPTALTALAHSHAVPLIEDLGSGALLDTTRFGLDHEPTPRERLAAGADIVTFSGDKLVGGPQAGLVVGRADLVSRIRRDPLARAMRPDKATLAGVAATLGLYRAGRAVAEIPVWQAIAADPRDLRERAERITAELPWRAPGRRVEVVEGRTAVGGGALPGQTLPSFVIRLEGSGPSRLAATLRLGEPCVVTRIEDGAVLLDLRTVPPEADESLAGALARALGTAPA
jgi:L-seryl-tRNA(Ser) seleniumtransferase